MSDLVQSVLDCCSCFSLLLAGVLLSWVPANAAQEASKPSHALSAEQKETMATFVIAARYLREGAYPYIGT